MSEKAKIQSKNYDEEFYYKNFAEMILGIMEKNSGKENRDNYDK